MGGHDFGWALTQLRLGQRVTRPGWNGKGLWLWLVGEWAVMDAGKAHFLGGLTTLPWIGMRTADGGFVPWLASQTDVLATDWITAT